MGGGDKLNVNIKNISSGKLLIWVKNHQKKLKTRLWLIALRPHNMHKLQKSINVLFYNVGCNKQIAFYYQLLLLKVTNLQILVQVYVPII